MNRQKLATPFLLGVTPILMILIATGLRHPQSWTLAWTAFGFSVISMIAYQWLDWRQRPADKPQSGAQEMIEDAMKLLMEMAIDPAIDRQKWFPRIKSAFDGLKAARDFPDMKG